MPDPFLIHHEVYPFCFNIGGRLSPVSIRDQMVRGRAIVDRLVAAGLIGVGLDLVVAGAGAAGVTAAMHAASLGVNAHLIERGPGPFAVQAGCTTRLINPTQYDWPLTHWDENRYPWVAPSMPLRWSRGLSSSVAASWHAQMRMLMASAAGRAFSFTPLHNVTLIATTGAAGPITVDVTPVAGGRPHTILAGALVSCIGFGSEDCSVPSSRGRTVTKGVTAGYTGFAFWETDPYNGRSWIDENVLISGGGDGALQDFLRIVTGQLEAQKIYRDLFAAAPRLRVISEFEPALQSAEDQASRAFAWSDSAREDHEILVTLRAAYARAISLIMGSRDWKRLLPRLSVLTTGAPNLTLVHRCNHFSRSYGLNQFLVMLIAEYFKTVNPANPTVRIIGDKEVRSIISADYHTCLDDPTACDGYAHSVDVDDHADCFGSSGILSRLPQDYHAIVVRHGIVPGTVPKPLRPILLPRQILPYHVSI